MRNVLGWFTGAMLAVAPAVPAAAQGADPAREGFYISGGLGAGWESVSCSECTSHQESGITAYLALGGTLSPQWRLGYESDAWTETKNSVTLTQGFYTAAVAFYPSPTNDFWLKGNVGYSLISCAGCASESGLAAGLGLGYDWHPTHKTFAIIPFANFLQQVSESNGDKWRLIMIGVGFGYKH
jgi:hypothetical protein